jgi:hypothetical protein
VNRRFVKAVILCASLASSSALAQGHYSGGGDGSIQDGSLHTRPSDFSLMAFLPWYYGFGIGVVGRYEIPILPDGFIPNINDEFSIEPGLGFGYRDYGVYGYNYGIVDVVPQVYGNWSFWFSPKFRAYFGLGLGYDIGFVTGLPAGAPTYTASFFYWDPVIGMYYSFAPNVAFRGELGSQGLKAGVAFLF